MNVNRSNTFVLAAVAVAAVAAVSIVKLVPPKRFVTGVAACVNDEAILLTRLNEDSVTYSGIELVGTDGALRWSRGDHPAPRA